MMRREQCVNGDNLVISPDGANSKFEILVYIGLSVDNFIHVDWLESSLYRQFSIGSIASTRMIILWMIHVNFSL